MSTGFPSEVVTDGFNGTWYPSSSNLETQAVRMLTSCLRIITGIAVNSNGESGKTYVGFKLEEGKSRQIELMRSRVDSNMYGTGRQL